jgi:23S rRNA-/tRNA-specific pseudouridylate synthase
MMTEPGASTSVYAQAPTRILCVGDGDLTLSLALVRAYGTKHLRVTASTLLASRENLIKTYSNSEDVLCELQERGVAIRFGVDATQLHLLFPRNSFDWICFSHPHLGLDTLRQDEAWHAQRHYRLLAHYLWSADQLGDANIHVCLCGKQAETWRLVLAAEATGLELVGTYDTAAPLNSWMIPTEVSQLGVELHYPAPRRYRNGKLGSKHFLGKFGYQHRLTHPSASSKLPNVDQSHHYVFRSNSREVPQYEPIPPSIPPFQCHVCGATYDSNDHLQLHLTAPALPNDPKADVGPKQARDNPEGHSNHTPHTIPRSTSNDVMATIVEWSGVVSSSVAGQRLRQFLRSTMSLSKKQSENRITSGCVSLNNAIVKDSSRIVRQNDAVEVRQLCYSEQHRVDIIHREDDWVVVMKLVGMRTLGTFSEETLERTVSRQLNQPYSSLSKLDTGCAGLCVLTKDQPSSGASPPSLKNVFTALVHGNVEAKETTLSMQSGSSRRWKRGRRSLDEVQEGDPDDTEDFVPSNAQDEQTIHVSCSERTDGDSVQLSTLKITATSNVRVDAICYALRKQGNPVVNDRFCRNEYLQLPRSIRNLIKMRLCIACFEVSVNSREIKVATPERLSSTYWHEHMVKSMENQCVEPHLPTLQVQ